MALLWLFGIENRIVCKHWYRIEIGVRYGPKGRQDLLSVYS